MEDALARVFSKDGEIRTLAVLILVLMEDALALNDLSTKDLIHLS